jgi:hypothetical protein
MKTLHHAMPFLLFAGALAAQTVDQTQRAVTEASQRGNARIFYWGQTGSVGQLNVDYGQPKWNAQFEAQWQQLQGKRWRMGRNHWTNLDTNIDLTLGGVKLPAGHYYMTLEQDKEGQFQLTFLDPAKAHARKLDAFDAWKTVGGIQVAMKRQELEPAAPSLTIALPVSGQNDNKASLVIRFGPHQFTAPIVMHRVNTVPK